MAKRITVFLLFYFLCNVALCSMPDTAQLEHFDLNTGFPSDNVYSVIQDRNGYLWFATDNGVVKYNGYSFKIFNTSMGLPSNDAYQLYEDDKGRIWVHTFSYQFGYIQNDKYVNISMQTHDRILRAYYTSGKGDFLFFGFWENARYSVAIIKGNDLLTSVPLYHMSSKMKVLSSSDLHFSDIFISHSCKLYGFGSDGWLYVYDLLRPGIKYKRVCKVDYDRFPISRSNSTYINAQGVMRFFENKADTLFLVRTDNCTYKQIAFNTDKEEYIYTVLDGDISPNKTKNITVITNMAIYNVDSNLVVTSRLENDSILHVKSQIAYVFTDRNKNTWYTTTNKGAWCSLRKNVSLVEDNHLSLLSDSKFLGSSKDGETFWWDKTISLLYVVDSAGTLEKIKFPLNTEFRGFAELNDTTLYVTLSSGMYMFNKRTHTMSGIIGNGKKAYVHPYKSNVRMPISNAKDERLFLGDHIAILLYSPNKFFSICAIGLYEYQQYKDSTVIKVLSDEHYGHILLDTLHNKIIGYNKNKIIVYDPVTETSVILGQDNLNTLGLRNIQNIEVDRFGNIYIAGDNKITVYDPLSMNVRPILTKFNVGNSFFHISGNDLVIAGSFGVAFAPILKGSSVGNFSIIPNVHNYYYNRVFDFAINAFGSIQLNTDKGFFRMDGKYLAENNSSSYFGKEGLIDLMISYPFQKKIVNDDTIRIQQGIDKISLDAINFYGNGDPVFEYSLDDSYNEVQQTNGEVFVVGMDVGKYYKISCVVKDNTWSNMPIVFYIYRIPHWWQTPRAQTVFWILAGVSVIILLLAIILLTKNIVARSNRKKRALTELELRAIYAQINPHFIFNTLSAAQFFINKKRFDDAYVHVNKFSKLLRAYLKSSQDRYITLDEEVQMLKNYIELQQIRFEEKFEYRLEIENKIPVNSIKIPSLLLQPLVENAINHGLFHRDKGGLLILKFLQGTKNNELICIIEDNGIGRKQSVALKKADSTQRESYGTKLTQQLIDIYREYEKMDIYLEYTDKTEPDTGTIVTLTIKNVKYVA